MVAVIVDEYRATLPGWKLSCVRVGLGLDVNVEVLILHVSLLLRRKSSRLASPHGRKPCLPQVCEAPCTSPASITLCTAAETWLRPGALRCSEKKALNTF